MISAGVLSEIACSRKLTEKKNALNPATEIKGLYVFDIRADRRAPSGLPSDWQP